MESFLRSQEELVEKFDSGFSGYRGLSGKNLLFSMVIYFRLTFCTSVYFKIKNIRTGFCAFVVIQFIWN